MTMPTNAVKNLIDQAASLGVKAEPTFKPESWRQSSLGQTHAPAKVVLINGIRMSLAQARQYINARCN